MRSTTRYASITSGAVNVIEAIKRKIREQKAAGNISCFAPSCFLRVSRIQHCPMQPVQVETVQILHSHHLYRLLRSDVVANPPLWLGFFRVINPVTSAVLRHPRELFLSIQRKTSRCYTRPCNFWAHVRVSLRVPVCPSGCVCGWA